MRQAFFIDCGVLKLLPLYLLHFYVVFNTLLYYTYAFLPARFIDKTTNAAGKSMSSAPRLPAIKEPQPPEVLLL